MHCHTWHQQLSHAALAAPVAAHAGGDPGIRIGDADRRRAAELLGEAAGAGFLTLHEVEERLGIVWSATTRADLASVTSDLPEELRRAHVRRAAAGAARAGLRVQLAAYAAVMLLLVAVWLTVGAAGGGWYPWPVWPALGWGLGLVGQARRTGVVPGRRS